MRAAQSPPQAELALVVQMLLSFPVQIWLKSVGTALWRRENGCYFVRGLGSNQFELLSATTDFPSLSSEMRKGVDLHSSVLLLRARVHDCLAFCLRADRERLRPFAAVFVCSCPSSLALVLPSFVHRAG